MSENAVNAASEGKFLIRRDWVYPADLKGRFRTLRSWVGAALIAFFVVTPWIRVAGLPAVQFDVPGRRFLLFGAIFTPHDTWALALMGLIAAICLFFFASVFGRVWCGWTCPQTVWLDRIFRPIERLIEGKANKRKKMDSKPRSEWPASWWARKIGKHLAFLGATAFITAVFMSWFVGGPQMVRGELGSTGWSVFAFIMFLGYLDAAWFREQLCVYACPYARFQGALMSEKSLIVAYDEQRGEPRKKGKEREGGDCISCMRCVQVCPAGIDIRNGDQLSCIACASCVDACDEIMIKIGKPVGLIRYTTDRDATGVKPLSAKTLGRRSFVYAAILVVLATVLVVGVAKRSPVKVAVARAVSTEIFRELPDGKVANQLTVHISNRANAAHTFTVRSATDDVEITAPGMPWSVEWGQEHRLMAFVSAPASAFVNGRLAATLVVERDDGVAVEARFDLLGPGGSSAANELTSGDGAAEAP